ncbi:hypothetical protein Taro_007467 [Colocasia esculenta]|uniref:Uncharacterized protein n=1 Tax=Colocasia esculenta TaxID=4460 RepID=A0A843TV49_COLES|nr:hypothetical protein [Colocasia esculenta]
MTSPLLMQLDYLSNLDAPPLPISQKFIFDVGGPSSLIHSYRMGIIVCIWPPPLPATSTQNPLPLSDLRPARTLACARRLRCRLRPLLSASPWLSAPSASALGLPLRAGRLRPSSPRRPPLPWLSASAPATSVLPSSSGRRRLWPPPASWGHLLLSGAMGEAKMAVLGEGSDTICYGPSCWGGCSELHSRQLDPWQARTEEL